MSEWELKALTEEQQAAFRTFTDRWGITGAADRVLEALS
jgi:hypothetical protein